ncbi:MAG: cytochrome c oxidase assembly protein [Candidatus Methylomirabilales bacterium]
MSQTTQALLASWNWRADVMLVVAPLALVYGVGWGRLRRQKARIAVRWRLVLYTAGLATICLALLSPIDTFGSFLFTMHMVQHELLVMVVPLLLLLSDPFPAMLWGLPRSLRVGIGHLLTRGASFRQVVCAATWMPISLSLFVTTLWAWHYPPMFEASLRNEFTHDAQHLSFFVTGILLWWPIVNPAPRVHGHVAYGLRIVYVLLAVLQNTLLAALISLTERVLYPYYTTVPRLWGLTPLEDQMTGGLIMWIPGGMMFVITVLVLVTRMLDREEQITLQREAIALRHGSPHGETPQAEG